MPDFRAAERTFQLITQVAGRGGRGETPGKVIIQTFNPQHYALKHAQNHDYKSFYTEEIDFRKALQYPPFGRIINLRLSSIKKDVLIEQAHLLGKMAKKLSARHGNIAEIIGRGIMIPPALFINGEKMAEGRIPDVNEIRKMLTEKKP